MRRFKEFRPTQFDHHIAIDDAHEEWFIAPCGTNRDADALTRSNWKAQMESLGGESETVEVHRFGHWGPGWFEICIIDPSDAKAVKAGEDMAASLADYPVLDESGFSEEEQTEANEVWEQCYRPKDRIEYIRDNRSQFEFHSLADMMGCVRGKYFAGYASELLG